MSGHGISNQKLPKNYYFSEKTIEILGIKQLGPIDVLYFFNQKITISGEGILASDLDISPAIRDLLISYLVHCPKVLPNAPLKLLTFREFSNAAPLFSMFTANTAKTVETHFSGRTDALALRCQELGAIAHDSPSHDLSVEFTALPRIPIIFNFNDQDEFMPASASFLYTNTAIDFLSLKNLMTIATYLTGCLIA